MLVLLLQAYLVPPSWSAVVFSSDVDSADDLKNSVATPGLVAGGGVDNIPRKLTIQTSVMNGTLDVETIDVDKVCDAGGVMDNDDPGWSTSR